MSLKKKTELQNVMKPDFCVITTLTLKNIYPLRASGFTFQEAKNLGFKVCKHQWSNCINLRKRNLGNF